MIPFVGVDLVKEVELIAVIGIKPAVVGDRIDVGIGGVRGIVEVAVPFDEALRVIAGDVVGVAQSMRLILIQVDQCIGGETPIQACAVVKVVHRRQRAVFMRQIAELLVGVIRKIVFSDIVIFRAQQLIDPAVTGAV